MNGRVFIDTNVVAYAHITNEQSKHETALNLLRSGLVGSRLWISTQILSEFYSVMTKNQYKHESIVELITAIMQYMNITSVAPETVELALQIKGKYQFSYWDSLMLAAALESDCDTVYTEDLQHGQVIEGKLTIKNPFLDAKQ